MADCKIITFWSETHSESSRYLIHELARFAEDHEQSAVVIRVGHLAKEENAVEDLSSWLERVRDMAPVLLRNYLRRSDDAFLRLSFKQWPETSHWKSLLRLLRNAYVRVYVIAPADDSTQAQATLDEADLLLALVESHQRPEDFLKKTSALLSAHHFSLRFCRLVTQGQALQQSPFEVLGVLPGGFPGNYRWRQAVGRLACALESQADLFKTVRALPEEDLTRQIAEDLKKRVQPEIAQEACDARVIDSQAARRMAENALAHEERLPSDRLVREKVLSNVLNEVLGLGPLEPLLRDPEISEIMVVGPQTVYVEKGGRLYPSAITFSSEKQLRVTIDRIVAPLGRRVDEAMPLCDARLSDGSRVNVVLPPLALDGPALTIRKFMARRLGLEDLMQMNSMDGAMAAYLRQAVLSRKNILISGGTGSGKTTLLNALSSVIPEDERIVTIEDAAELRLQKPHVVRLEARPANAEGQGEIPIRRLVVNALRMRPDRLVIGECRGSEALDMLQAMNTGHEGSLTTVHANTPRDALSRLETLVLMAGMDLPVRVVREQIRSAIHVVIQQSRCHDGRRRVTSVMEITGLEGETLMTQELFRFQNGHYESTGYRSRWEAR